MKTRLLLLSLLALPSAVLSSNPSQHAFPPPAPAPSSVTLVDLLSASTNHTLLVQAFQRARLIPFLNRLNGSTLLAPSDEAIKAAREKEKAAALLEGGKRDPPVWGYALGEEEEQATVPTHDNLQLELRDTLLYHLLNYTLFPPPASNASSIPSSTAVVPELHETLYHPSLSPYNKSYPYPPTLPGSPPDDPDPDKPKPIEGLLRGRGQKLRIMRNGKKEGQMVVGTDWSGAGGVSVQKDSRVWGTRDVLVVLDSVLDRPKDLATVIRTTPELSTFAALLPPSLLDYVSTAAHLTLFAPTNDAWGQLSPLEMRYLRSGFAEKDLTEIFGDAASSVGVGEGQVGYLDVLLGKKRNSQSTVPTFYDAPLVVAPTPQGPAVVNATVIETPDILASNGVLHTVPSLLLPSGSLSLTAEKYLLALNATKFVALLRSVNLSHYVQVPSGLPTFDGEAYTILAPQDSVLNAFLCQRRKHMEDEYRTTDGGEDGVKASTGVPEPGSEALKELLEYHIVSGKWTADTLRDGMLVGTELRGESLAGARQKLVVSVQSAEIGLGRQQQLDKKLPGGRGEGVVAFGGAGVVADPVQVGNSIIYLLASVLEPPTSLVTTAVSDLRLSTFVASIYAASLDKPLSKAPAITYLVPSNDAFSTLGLVMSYLLLPTARPELRSVLRYHAIDELVYLDEFPVGGSVRYPTLLDGAEIYVERSSYNASLAVHGPTVGGLPANGETRDGRVVEGDVLTSTGVLHIIDQVELPPDLSIGIQKLLRGARANTMADLIRAANMSWILDGTPPPVSTEEAEVEKLGRWRKRRKGQAPIERIALANQAFTVLCPTDKALARLNLTYYLSDPVALSDLVRLHIIPTDAFAPLAADGRPLPLTDEATFPTLLDTSQGGTSQYGQVAFRRWGEDDWLVGIKSARGTDGGTDSARVVAYGRATPWFLAEGDSTRLAGGGGVLTIDSVLIPYRPTWFRRWGWIVVVALLGGLLALLITLLVIKMVRGKKTQYERLEGEED